MEYLEYLRSFFRTPPVTSPIHLDNTNPVPPSPVTRIQTDALDNNVTIHTQNPVASNNNQLFALIIGIDEYAAGPTEFPSLRGSVNDAKAMKAYLITKRQAHPPNILCLEDSKATRKNILSTFKTHFLENNNIPNDGTATMIFFFSGHGSRAKVVSGDRMVEVICPADERTGEDEEYVHAIPDYVLGWLIRELAHKKGHNITVILDCCYSGGHARDPAKRSRSVPPDDSHPIPALLDCSLWEGKIDKIESYRLWSPHPPFVLLAACSQAETAWEKKFDGKDHGQFTKHLLERLVATDLDEATYEELIDKMPRLEKQIPHCGGIGKNRVVFKGCYPLAGPDAVVLTPYRDGKVLDGCTPETIPENKDFHSSQLFQIKMGTVAGVVPGSEFSICAPDNKFLGTFVADSVEVAQTILIAKEGTPSSEIPRESRAVVSNWKHTLLQVYIPTDFPQAYISALFPTKPTRRTLRFVRASYLEAAHVIVRSDGKHISIDQRMGLMSKYQREIRFALNDLPADLSNAFDSIVHFNYFLDHTNVVKKCPLKDMFTLEMHHLEGDYPYRTPGRNMVENGEVQFTSEAGAKYGFTICSRKDCPDDLFPYLFWFDPDDFTITLLYDPESRNEAPLKKGQTLPIGMGATAAFEYTLPKDMDSSTGFLKLFVTNRHIDLSWIEQKVSFASTLMNPRLPPPTRTREPELSEATWDAVTVPLTMMK